MLAFVIPALITAELIVGLVLPHGVGLTLSAAVLIACLLFFAVASWSDVGHHGSRQK